MGLLLGAIGTTPVPKEGLVSHVPSNVRTGGRADEPEKADLSPDGLFKGETRNGISIFTAVLVLCIGLLCAAWFLL